MSAEKSETIVMEKSQETEIRNMTGEELRQVDNFKYLRREIEAEGGTLRTVKQRIKAAWTKWRKMAGNDKETEKRFTELKIYRTLVRPVLMYWAECWTMRKKKEDLMRGTEMRMSRWIVDKEHRDQKKMWSREHCGKGERSKTEMVQTCGKKR